MKASTARSMGLALGERVERAAVPADEGGVVPADDRRDRHLVGDRIHEDALRPRRALGPDCLELAVQTGTLEGLAAKPRAADRAPAQRQKQPRLSELGQNRPLDRVERDARPAARWIARSKAPGIWRMLDGGYSGARPGIG